jgi:hypothetical protein
VTTLAKEIAANVYVLHEYEPCVQGDCDNVACAIVEVGVECEDETPGTVEVALCREHVHGFIDLVFDQGFTSGDA